MNGVDVIVVGAGVAGSSIAYSLGRKGLHVQLIEKHLEVPETIKGELLQPGGVASLHKLGLEDCLVDIDAQPVHGFAVLDKEQERILPYPSQLLPRKPKRSQAPCQGYSFRHHRFVESLRQRACEQPNVRLQQGTVRELIVEANSVVGVRYRGADREQYDLHAPLTILASGRNKHIWKQLGHETLPQKVARSVGVTLRGCDLPCPYHGHVFLIAPSPTLGYQIGTEEVRLLIDVPGHLQLQKKERLLSFLRNTIGPQLPESLHEPLEIALQKGEYMSMQSLVLAPAPATLGGVITLGDALNMRHPLTGAGMTVALHDAACLTDFVTHSALYDSAGLPWTRQFYRKREPLAMTVDTLSSALYDIFRADQPGLELMRDAVMQYWQLGGMAVSGPMSLLAGMNPNPFQLFLHYSAVALLGMGRPLLSNSPDNEQLSVGRMRSSVQLGLAAVRTMAPHIRRGLQLFR